MPRHSETITIGEKLRAYISLTKVIDKHKPTLIYAYYALSGTELAHFLKFPFTNAILVTLAVLFSTFGIYSLNDIYDLEEDKINFPERPLPSGLVTVKEAYILTIAYFIVANFFAIFVGSATLFLTLVYIFLGIAYSVPPIRLKRTVFSYLVIGSGFFLSTLIGSTAAFPSQKSAYLGCIMFAIVTGLGPLKDFEYIEGDRKAGLRTIPIRLGRIKTARLIAITIIVPIGMLFIAPFLYIFNEFFLPLASICSVLMLGGIFILLKNPEDNSRYAYQVLEMAVFLLPLAFTIGTAAF